MAIVDITKIRLFRGPSADLPTQLDDAELAFTTDDGRLFVGFSGDSEIVARDVYPYSNLEVLTENALDLFANLHGARMKEGGGSDYYSAVLNQSQKNWQPVLVLRDGTWFNYTIGEIDNVTAFMDYAVYTNAGETIRLGHATLRHYDANEAEPFLEDHISAGRDLAALLQLEPNEVFQKVDLRFRVAGPLNAPYLLFEYRNPLNEAVNLRFKVSRPKIGYYDTSKETSPEGSLFGQIRIFPLIVINSTLASAQAPIVVTMTATASYTAPIVSGPLLLRNSGFDSNLSNYGDSVETYTNNFGYISMTKVDADGNIYLIGGDNSFNGLSVVVKYSPTGEFLWQRGYSRYPTDGDYSANFFYGLYIDNDGNVLCVGTMMDSLGFEAGLLVKLDPSGNEIFRRVYTDANVSRNLMIFLRDVVQTPDAIFVTGSMEDNGQNNGKSFTARINPTTGAIVWFNRVESTTNLMILTNALKMDSAGNLLEMGRIDYTHMTVRKFAQDGTLIFAKVHSHHPYGYHNEAIFTLGPDDSIYVAEVEADEYNTILLTKFDTNGELVWQKRHGFDNYNSYIGLPNTIVGATTIYLIAGFKSSQAGDFVMIMELNLGGEFQRIRYCEAGAFFDGYDSFDLIAVTMANDHFYIAYNQASFYIESRRISKGVLVVPVEWDGSEVIDFEGLLYVRAPRPNSLEVMTRLDLDTTINVLEISNPSATYNLATTTATEIALSSLTSYDFFIDNVANPKAIAGPTSGYSIENVVANENFWMVASYQTSPDYTQTNRFTPYPFESAVDSSGNIYTMGYYTSAGLYVVGGNTDKIYIQKTTVSGVVEWTKSIVTPTTYFDAFGLITVDETGIYIVTNAVSGLFDILALKISLDGSTILWNKRIEGGDAATIYWATDCMVNGSSFEIVSYNYTGGPIPTHTYTMRFDRTTGNLTNAISYNAANNTGNLFPTQRIYDGVGNYYMLMSDETPTNLRFILSKHLVSDNSIVWQRTGRATPVRYRTDIDCNFVRDPVSGNLYISATLIDQFQLGGRPKSRRLLLKYAPDGTVLAQKIYRVTLTNDKPVVTGILPSNYIGFGGKCVWMGDRLLTCAETSLGIMIDAFDANLNPIWGKTIYQAGEYQKVSIARLTNDSVVVTSKTGIEEPAQFLFRLPIDGNFAIPSETALFFYPLTYAENTQYTFIDEVSTHIISVLDHTSAPLITNITTSTIVNYPHIRHVVSPPLQASGSIAVVIAIQNTASGTFTASTVPAWVEALRAPSGDLPLIAADWTTEKFWALDSEVTQSSIFVENINWDSYSELPTAPDGLNIVAQNPALSASARALVTDEATCVVTGFFPTGTFGSMGFEFAQVPGYPMERYAQIGNGSGTNSYLQCYDTVQNVQFSPPNSTANGSIGRLSATLTLSQIRASVDGSAVVGGAIATPNVATNVAGLYAFGNGNIRMRSLALYAPQPNADLPTLSSI